MGGGLNPLWVRQCNEAYRAFKNCCIKTEINEKVENVTCSKYTKRNHNNKQLFNMVFTRETLRQERYHK